MIKKTSYRIYIAPVLLGLVFSCSTTTEKIDKADTESDLVEITPFIINKVMLYDTTQLKNFPSGMLQVDYMQMKGAYFLDQAGLNAFRTQMNAAFMNPKSLIYYSPFDETPLTQKQKRDKYMKCDSLMQTNVDASGKEVTTEIFACDSTSFFYMMSTINFYESWYYNKRTSEIEKKQLGYSVWQYDSDKEAFRELFIYFVSEEARKKAIKYF